MYQPAFIQTRHSTLGWIARVFKILPIREALLLKSLTLPFPDTMSQSQYSDAFSSSLYDSDINLAYLTPENEQLATISEPSTSQLAINSFDPEFLRPPIPLLVPEGLTRVGPDRRKAFVLYNEMVDKEFMDWWIRTQHGGPSNTKIRWDSKHQSKSWDEFDQVAHSSDGAPKVMCKRCGAILEHPQSLSSGTTARQGTSTMGKHLKGTGCTKAARHRTQKSGITRFIKATVCLYLSYLVLYYY